MIMNSIATIINESRKTYSTVPNWFDKSTMEFFHTKVDNEVMTLGRHGTLFVTCDSSDGKNFGYTVRWAFHKDMKFHIITLGELMEHEDHGDAWRAVEVLSTTIGDIVRFWE